MSQADFKKRLKALMLLPENQVCSDCPERQPRWASLIVPPPGAPPGSMPMGAFCCLECSGSHRRLGVHISFVRSINLDQWKEKEVLAMENGGNRKVNLIFEANLNISKPSNTASGPIRERFIRDKYERRKFYDPNAFVLADQEVTTNHHHNHHRTTSNGEQQQVIAGVQRRLAGETNHIRKPSDAARKRVEERAARNRQNPTVVVASAPAPVADLLDFGDFDSPEATAAVATSSMVSNEPMLDVFETMSAPTGGGTTHQPPPPPQQPPQQKLSNADILSMFHSPNPNAMQQNNMLGMGGGMSGGMQGGGNRIMNPNGTLGNFNNVMMNPNTNFGGGNSMTMNSMGLQVGNHTMMGGGNTNSMGGMNHQMMMTQQQFHGQMQHNMHGGMMAQGGNQFAQSSANMSPQQQTQKNSQGGSYDQFSQFGNFGR